MSVYGTKEDVGYLFGAMAKALKLEQPSEEARATFTFRDPLGHQVLVDVWLEGVVTVCTRNSEFSTWGAPLELVRREVVS